mmetsp:Transcript_40025/g.103595  ORF Transcript_40025/g.103595 Transcript_40025/m.103595 type:complete len:232 (+) Transcript_40025:476-1171(+)
MPATLLANRRLQTMLEARAAAVEVPVVDVEAVLCAVARRIDDQHAARAAALGMGGVHHAVVVVPIVTVDVLDALCVTPASHDHVAVHHTISAIVARRRKIIGIGELHVNGRCLADPRRARAHARQLLRAVVHARCVVGARREFGNVRHLLRALLLQLFHFTCRTFQLTEVNCTRPARRNTGCTESAAELRGQHRGVARWGRIGPSRTEGEKRCQGAGVCTRRHLWEDGQEG